MLIQYITATNDNMELLMSSRLEMLKVVNNLPDDYTFSEELVTYSKEYFEKGDQTTILAVDEKCGVKESDECITSKCGRKFEDYTNCFDWCPVLRHM